ncbi:hypothetical protein GLU60_04200 [Nanohaloarchaea archaeon H01]|jgi:hypothetical protein|nr:hypothetical protein [Nanohaloarchaea archaeon H01]
MTRRTLQNRIEDLEQQSSDDGLNLVVVNDDGCPHDETQSVETADMIITVSEETYSTWD